MGRLKGSRAAVAFGAVAMVAGLLTVASVTNANALPVHGLGFFKGCDSPTQVLQKTSCNFSITNTSDPDALTVTSLVDVVHGAAGDDSSGNILATLTWSFAGGASCNAGQTVCSLPQGGKMSTDPTAIGNVGADKPFLFHTVTGADADNKNPLADDALLTWNDLCTSHATNCPVGPQTATTGSQTVIVKLPSSTDTQIHNAAHQVVTAVEAGKPVHDFVSVTGPVGSPTPTGSVNVDWFTNGNCSGTAAANSGVVALAGGSVDVTGFVRTPVAGQYGFKAHYTGDPNYQPSDGPCEPLTVVDAAISISPDATNEVNHSHTFTVTVLRNDGTGFVPAPGIPIVYTLTDSNGASHTTSPNPPTTCDSGTDGTGKCNIVFTSATGGKVVGNASVTMTLAGVTITRDTDPATATIPGPGGSGPATKTFVDANITIAPDATNEVGKPHTFTVTVKRDLGNGNGLVNVPNGTKPVVTLTSSNGAAASVTNDVCATAGTTAGKCTVTFSSPTAGKVTGNASVNLTVGGVSLSRDTDPVTVASAGPGGSGPAVKTYVDANITITPSTATNEVGHPHTFTVTVKQNNGNGSFVNVPDGTKPVVTLTNSNGAVNQLSSDTCAATGTVNGQCSVTFTSPSAGVVTGNASVTLVVGGVTLNRDTNPATANVGAGPGGSGPAVKTFVDARINIAPAATNEVGQPHTFTVTVKQNAGDGSGFVNVPDGTKPVVTLTNANGAANNVSTNTCTSTGTVAGVCTVTFTSPTAGTVTGNATVTLTVGGVTLTRDTDPATATIGSGPGGSGPAVKTFVDANITISPTATNEVGVNHTFNVTVKRNSGNGNGFVTVPDGAHPVVTLTNSNGAAFVLVTDTCATTGTVGGKCAVTFNSPTAGKVTANASVTITVGGVTLTRDTDPATANVGAGPGGSGPAVKTYVDANITITPSATNEVGKPHTFTITVQRDTGAGTGLVNVPNGAKPVVTLTNGNGAAFNISSNTCTTTGTVAGKCTVTFTSPSAGTVTGNASVTLAVGGVTLTRDTDPATATIGAGPGGSGPALKTFVDASIAISPNATNEVGNNHTFTVTAKQNAGDGNNFVSVPNGTKPVVTLTNNNGAAFAIVTNTCATTGTTNGQCGITFTSPSSGTITGNATMTITVGGVTLTRDTDPATTTIPAGPGGSGPAVKTFVDANITITPTATNEVNHNHTFIVTVQQNAGDGNNFVNAPDGTKPVVTLSNTNGAANQVSSNTCASTGTVAGQCAVTFTSPSAGLVTGNASVTLTVGGVTMTRDTDPATVAIPAGPGGSGPALKTFVDANITITPSATNEVGQNHTFTITVKRNLGDGNNFVNAPNGTKPTVTLTNSNGAAFNISTNTCSAPGTTAGQCSVTFTSPTAGLVTGNASVTLTVGGVSLTRDTDPATAAIGAGPNGSGPALKTFVDANITITPNATNEVNNNHTFTVTVKQNAGDGNSFVNVPDGTHPTVSLANNNGAAFNIVTNTCLTTGTVNGQCGVTFTSPSSGTVVGNASVSLVVGGVPLTRDTDPATATIGAGPGGSGPATKTFVDAFIKITPPTATNEVGQPHTFTVTVKQSAGGAAGFVNVPNGTKPTVTLTNSNNAAFNISTNTCSTTGTVAGQCTVTFTSPTAGLVTGNASVTLTVGGVTMTRDTDPATVAIGAGPGGSGPALKTFVDANITISPDATNEVGQNHTFTVTVKQNAGTGNGFVNVPNGTKPVVTLTDNNGSAYAISTNTCTAPGTVAGKCTVTFSSPSAGKVIGNATVTLTVGGVSLTRDTDPATANVGAGPGGSGPATKTYVDANITITPNATNEVNNNHTFTVTVKQNGGDGNNFVNVPDGTKPVVTLTNNNGAAFNVVTNTCLSAGTVNGQCSITFTSPTSGTVVGNASVTIVVGGVSLTRDTDPATATVGAGPGGSGPATKTFVDAFITITPSATNEVGQPHTFTVTVKQDNGGPGTFANVPNGTHPTVTLANTNGAGYTNVVDTCASTGTVAGQCTVTFTSPTAGVVTGNASVTLTVGGVTMTRDTDPATANVGAGPGGSGPAVKTFVDANITITPDATNEVGKSHTFTVTVKQNLGDGNNFVNAPNGTKPVVTLTDSNGSAYSISNNTCTAPGTVAGKCTVTFSSPSAGKVIGNAAVTFTVGGVSLTRDTDPATASVGAGPGGSGPATKTYVDANITIAPNATNEVNNNHTFTVTVQQDDGSGVGMVNVPDGTKPTVTLTNSNNAAFSLVTDTCANAGTVNGQCAVTFTSPSAGQVTGNASVTISVGGVSLTRDTDPSTLTIPAGPGGSGPAVKTFVDALITIAPDATNDVNQTHTFTVTVKRNLGTGGGFVNVPNGTKPTVTLANTNGAGYTNVVDNCASAGTTSGQCTVTFSSPTAGKVTGNASVTLTISGVSITRDTDPATATIGAGPGGSGPAVKTYVDAFITIGPAGTNLVTDPHTFTVTVKQNAGDGNNFVNVPDGTKPVVTLTDAGGAVHQTATDTCASVGTVNGQCSVTFTSATTGTTTGNAYVTLPIGGISISRDTDPATLTVGAGPGGSGPAVKTWINIPTSASTAQFAYPNDTATVTSQAVGDKLPAGGTVTFRLYQATNGGANTALANCTAASNTLGSGGLIYMETKSNVGGAHQVQTQTSNTSVRVTTNGTYYWLVVYDPGDQAHTGRSSQCVENTTFTFTNDPGPGTSK
jgi:hypothetical protein